MIKYLITAIVVGVMSFGVDARADNIDEAQWYDFSFGLAGTALDAGSGTLTDPNSIGAPIPGWIITLTNPGYLTILDLGIAGDMYEFTSGANTYATSTVSASSADSSCGTDIGCALTDPNYSKGVFYLQPGVYDFTGTVTQNATGTTGGVLAGFEVTDAPEPASMTLLGVGLLGLGALRRRKRA